MNSLLPEGQTIVALSGGVGGAKLALGLSHVLNAAQLKIIVNTADDFTHLGLRISPDLDTLAYTLADLANKETGWGRAGESWNFMTALSGLGGETWFQLGDKDLALHVERTRQLTIGKSLTQVTCDLAAKLGIGPGILPMSDDPVQTTVLTHFSITSSATAANRRSPASGLKALRTPTPPPLLWRRSPAQRFKALSFVPPIRS